MSPKKLLCTLLILSCTYSRGQTTEPTTVADAHDNTISYILDNLQSTDECQNNSPNSSCDNSPPNVSFEYRTEDAQTQQRLNTAFESDKLGIDHCNYPNSTHLAAEDQGTLRQVLLIHRHGDRTPISFPPKDPLANESFWKFHGYGQLTNRGKARLYVMGQLTRKRYEKFINRSVNKNMRLSRASGALRCIESAQVFLASFLPLNAQDSPDAQTLAWNSGCDKLGNMWQPASIQTMAIPLDGMLAEGSECNALMDEYDNVINKSKDVESINQKYQDEAKVLKQVMGFQFDYFYKWFWASSQIEVERSYFGDRVDSRVLAVYDRVQDAGRLALLAYQSTLKSRRLRSGLLINDMIENMKQCRQQALDPRNEGLTKKFIHYSSHDLNLLTLIGVLSNIDRFPFRPDYASNVILELHQDGQEWFVKFFYMPHVPSKLFQMHIDLCESNHPKKRCTLDKLEQIMQPYIIKSWMSWMKECGNDLSKIDPYTPNH